MVTVDGDAVRAHDDLARWVGLATDVALAEREKPARATKAR
jgi:hypothetical protein